MSFTVEPRQPAAVRLARLRASVDERLSSLLPEAGDDQAGVAAAMRAAVMTPGKRLRPLLMLATGHALACRGPALLDLACAIEMVHCASLVLDDMPAMDDALLRRGQPTVHVRFGEDVAMLAAVALVSEACRIAAGTQGLRPAARVRIVEVLCHAVGPAGLVHGQYRDLRENAQARSSAEVAEVNDQKTSLLFAAAMEIAAYAAGAPRAVPTLRRAAFAIGQAFQLRDDLEDMAVDDGPVTEDPLQDTGKATLLAIAGPAAVRQAIDAQLADAVALLHAALGDDALWPQLLRMAFPEAARHLPASRQAGGPQRGAAPQRGGMSQGMAA